MKRKMLFTIKLAHHWNKCLKRLEELCPWRFAKSLTFTTVCISWVTIKTPIEVETIYGGRLQTCLLFLLALTYLSSILLCGFFIILEAAMNTSVQLQMQALFNPVTQIKCFLCFSLFWGFSVCWEAGKSTFLMHWLGGYKVPDLQVIHTGLGTTRFRDTDCCSLFFCCCCCTFLLVIY